ncbi:MAG: prepilin-type N-terminal cleavage/methylation domain-containing protein [Syntrophales bacterium]|jgi:MSHA pilin protein MshC|nr:prepilin-type N-terminal cleavage/methylation domain-containing protein [Syntrophales bacterium]MCU0554491.1 prepilin-type N-terminal cleavage/methylation domain-containing protein [Syntrophales bacterium]MCU0584170.1 prepilin-type N-terminal cleavage/methylation domain-containing protein [Syntrophales bacterium]
MRRSIRRGRFGGQGGFTLFEIIMVLLLLGVISYVAATRLFSDDAPTQVAEMELVKNHLRYAQARAMNSESSWGIKFGSSTRYWLFNATNENTVVRLPDVETADGAMQLNGIQVTPPSGSKITFDSFGSPGTATIVLTTTAGNITVTKTTGFIP